MPQPHERRAAERFPVTTETSCQFAATIGQDLGAARIQNVSTDGIGLVLSRRVEAGTRLAITIAVKGKPFYRTLLVRIVHVTPQPGGSFLVGGDFDKPLTYDELRTLVM